MASSTLVTPAEKAALGTGGQTQGTPDYQQFVKDQEKNESEFEKERIACCGDHVIGSACCELSCLPCMGLSAAYTYLKNHKPTFFAKKPVVQEEKNVVVAESKPAPR